MSSMDLSAIERAKIDCAEKLFNSISTANVKYHEVASDQGWVDGMNAIGWYSFGVHPQQVNAEVFFML